MEESMSGFCMRSGNNNGNSSGTKCGRWNPTTEQVKLLTELFRSGLRTPSTDQIQRISTQLSFYGKIESKNVFYWFQNHKARERQKRRKVNNNRRQSSLYSYTNNCGEANQVSEPERVMQTLELFPLNSFGESESERLRVQQNECISYTVEEQVDYPPLDLRLSFL